MNYLTDTHLLLWTLFSSEKISKKVQAILSESESPKFISNVTFWEISLKFSLGKLELRGILPDELPSFSKKAGFKILELDTKTTASFYKLPILSNKDPFDRMLAWQAIQNNFCLLTEDKGFTSYKKHGLKTAW